MPLPERRALHQPTPPRVAGGACFFVTICTSPRGLNQLATTTTAPSIIESVVRYHELGTWWVHLFLVMPDHVHTLVAVPPEHTLAGTIRAWKAWQTKTRNIRWQPGFFDHRLRSDESFEEKAHYIRQNPVRAGLVARAEDWPFVWSP